MPAYGYATDRTSPAAPGKAAKGRQAMQDADTRIRYRIMLLELFPKAVDEHDRLSGDSFSVDEHDAVDQFL